MAEHKTLYLKYRPTDFKAVKGQDHIVTVLEGAIAKKQIPHALLFCGSRGTGKTTIARIFSEAVGVSGLDTYEIDAASNRGVDDIRAIREAVHTLPYEGERKAYIIDEVHMLTKEAFNALLKTLEEPPDHVIFILATTERDKLPDTVTSRCQVFTFKSPGQTTLRDYVTKVAKAEGFELTDSAADMIAVSADGSFRDALGVVQKVITAAKSKKADEQEVATIISAPKTKLLMAITTALHQKDTTTALATIKEAAEAQVDMKLFARLLLERLRTVIILRYQPEQATELLTAYKEEEQTELKAFAKDKNSPINSHLLLRFLTATNQIGTTYLPELPLELAIVEGAETKAD